MKWTMINYKGEKQTWYSADVIERIRKIANECNYLDDREAMSTILDIIESEDK